LYLFWVLLRGEKVYEVRVEDCKDLSEFVVFRAEKSIRKWFPWNLEARIMQPIRVWGSENLRAATRNGRDLGMTEEQMDKWLKKKPNAKTRWFFLYPLRDVRFSGVVVIDTVKYNQQRFMRHEYPKSASGRLMYLPAEAEASGIKPDGIHYEILTIVVHRILCEVKEGRLDMVEACTVQFVKKIANKVVMRGQATRLSIHRSYRAPSLQVASIRF
jgi:hypothetical protein